MPFILHVVLLLDCTAGDMSLISPPSNTHAALLTRGACSLLSPAWCCPPEAPFCRYPAPKLEAGSI
eukprot:543065-Rhodomonas_salina.2